MTGNPLSTNDNVPEKTTDLLAQNTIVSQSVVRVEYVGVYPASKLFVIILGLGPKIWKTDLCMFGEMADPP